ncbi:Uncharacterised protein [Vibrio cholerae]|nr:Uncharacterised protein [Vibrio cholerae]
MRKSHFTRIGNRPTRLLFQIGRSTIPKLGDIQTGIEHSR